MNKLNSSDLEGLFAKVKDVMIENKDWLFELDSAMGDGDLGITMSTGFSKVYEMISALEEEDIGKIFMKVGMTLAETVPSTLGTLMATGFMRAGKTIQGKTEVDLANSVLMASVFVEGIIERGKAKPGEKTIIDSLYPAFQALKLASEEGKNLKEGFKKAYEAAKGGVEDTKEMLPKHGRVVWYREKSIGKKDPGAVAGMLLIKAFYEYLENKK
ncbi:MAG: dihydroxyacetone kinase subunit L [Firmicutes bacterium]|nr:dihydroxyacetone kinase subunit L [Bacillota bacterium]MBE3115300.1 dihydroxyacetone kinase subunit L [Actinomycetota bacterium]